MTLPKLAGSDTSSLSVNQYRWINFWTAILGQFLTPFPAFFDIRRIYGKRRWQFFLTTPGKAHIFILLFTPLIGIKRRARLIKKAHELSSRDATSSRVKQSVFTESRSGVCAGCSECIALACRWPVSGQCGGDPR
ncbi:hypothetical protein [Klebsiella spallanzanii]|uniref:hypothetical protein n=1 Tax=Klebsiella spallanzanii TaxID=2587528 RepID=UPI00259A54B0|nr:hypothetical protein [Klebsiella spallanzanii]MDM4205738.1 hypothetical protein [Klebsiella spallanzanii]